MLREVAGHFAFFVRCICGASCVSDSILIYTIARFHEICTDFLGRNASFLLFLKNLLLFRPCCVIFMLKNTYRTGRYRGELDIKRVPPFYHF